MLEQLYRRRQRVPDLILEAKGLQSPAVSELDVSHE